MAKFMVTITETLKRNILISDADSICEAEEKAHDLWCEGKIVLGAEDFTGETVSGVFMTEHRYNEAMQQGTEEY